MSTYRTSAIDTDKMPPGIPYIIGNEAAERFSFYGMRTILVVFMVQYLHLMDGAELKGMSKAEAMVYYHNFTGWVYFTPLIGALIADIFIGKYSTIFWLSLAYCIGHGCLALMGTTGDAVTWMIAGLIFICIGAGGIKSCVAAHVGDQFGKNNQHLLTRIYNWFYFSINFGSFFSTALTPWLLVKHGPHWAFGVPGVLMAIATLMFWLGRNKFVHIPPARSRFFDEAFSRDGLVALGKLIPLFLFIAVFWGLYDQTGSSWVLQAQQLDLQPLPFLDWKFEASAVQAVNPILILLYIPLFNYLIYPAVDRVFKLTPLRKLAIGLFLMAISFWLVGWVQGRIDAGESPSVRWQIACFIIITASEVMVSIVGLEFAYTQAPKTMKSWVVALFYMAVWAGNLVTAKINHYIQIPSAASAQLTTAIKSLPADWKDSPRNVVLPGFDGQTGTDDDFIQHLTSGKPDTLEIPGQAAYASAAATIEAEARASGDKLPAEDAPRTLGKDPWGNPIQYKIIDSTHFRLMSDGPEKKANNQWNQGVIVTVKKPEAAGTGDTWLERRKKELGIPEEKATTETLYSSETFSGGQTKLEGQDYFQFFTWLMLGTAIVFVPFALAYRPKTYLHD
ncbi:POT family MFS transporter [Luteolibacter sp. GHJ8]|uniref:POT family MFS transporter n=1 Tax=Luteolibacter rhizosphaerae TaxID=2989719 RepID=A0ABT3G7X5_9BACT|nr:POT family MFS transporter [Luteolibacter rhizosphaerae]MCW1915957.1 POT family MFS transporter [Luteolibacter rhizosphaerae]